MADTSPMPGRWAFRPAPPQPRSITELIRAGTLDVELAATVWVLLEARVPLIVAAAPRLAGKTTLLEALLDFVPPDIERRDLRGLDETFDWLPQASELGWSGVPRSAGAPRPAGGLPPAGAPVRPDNTLLVAAELSEHTPAYTWGEAARVFVRAATVGYGIAATIHGDSLDDVFAALASPPVGLTPDELSRLGAVLVLRPVDAERRRVVAAHYVRPLARDVHGHVQRLNPAVLATWDPDLDRFEHFGWGIGPELAARVGIRAGDFEIDVATRGAVLQQLLEGGVIDRGAVRSAIARHRLGAETASLAAGSGPGA